MKGNTQQSPPLLPPSVGTPPPHAKTKIVKFLQVDIEVTVKENKENQYSEVIVKALILALKYW